MRINSFIQIYAIVLIDDRRPFGRPSPGAQSSRRFRHIARYAPKSPKQLPIRDLAGLHAPTSEPEH